MGLQNLNIKLSWNVLKPLGRYLKIIEIRPKSPRFTVHKKKFYIQLSAKLRYYHRNQIWQIQLNLFDTTSHFLFSCNFDMYLNSEGFDLLLWLYHLDGHVHSPPCRFAYHSKRAFAHNLWLRDKKQI